MLFPNQRIERKYRLLAQHAPELDLALEGSFMENLAVAIRTSSLSERQQALDRAIEAYEKALDKVLNENGWALGEE
jgi:hypothetical protein